MDVDIGQQYLLAIKPMELPSTSSFALHTRIGNLSRLYFDISSDNIAALSSVCFFCFTVA